MCTPKNNGSTNYYTLNYVEVKRKSIKIIKEVTYSYFFINLLFSWIIYLGVLILVKIFVEVC